MAALPGVKLAFWDTGGPGEPVVLLHPRTGSAEAWPYQQPAFARAGHRVIAYSRRGHGRSDRGPENDLERAVDDLNNLMDLLKVDRFHIVASAAGGFVVPDYALSHPDRLLSMTIACSQGGVIEPGFRSAITALAPPGFAEMPPSFRELSPAYRAGYPEGVAAWEALEEAARPRPTRIEQPPKNALTWKALSRIRTPALVIAGAADLYMPSTLMLDYAGHLPNCETAILGEAGHSGNWEQPIAFNRLVLDFVGRHRRTTSQRR
jgi:pimeloyl-ACP methyl ester carboxylesterase